MGDLSRHFSRSETWCKCADPHCSGKSGDVDPRLIIGLEEVHAETARRMQARVRIIAISWVRCMAHDKWCNDRNRRRGFAVRKSDVGEHFYRRAIDPQVQYWGQDLEEWFTIDPKAVRAIAESCPTWYDGAGGIGVGRDRVHLDVRPGPGARWTY